MVTLIVKLTQDMIKYILGQHELCRNVTKIKDIKKRERLMVRKRMMNYRIRKKVKEAINELQHDIELLQSWKYKSDLETLENDLKIVVSSPNEELRKIFRQKGRGYARNVSMRCRECGKVTIHDIVGFRDRIIIGDSGITGI